MKKIKVTNRRSFFSKLSRWTAQAMGQPPAFVLAVLVIVTWGLSGPLFHFSDTWQLVINTGTTVVTFLMVFLIQATQNRDSHAVQLKLDELIRATTEAHAAMMDLEELTDKELCQIKTAYTKLAEEARTSLRKGGKDTGVPDVLFETFSEKAD